VSSLDFALATLWPRRDYALTEIAARLSRCKIDQAEEATSERLESAERISGTAILLTIPSGLASSSRLPPSPVHRLRTVRRVASCPRDFVTREARAAHFSSNGSRGAARVTGHSRRAAIIALLWSRRSTVFRPFPRPSVRPSILSVAGEGRGRDRTSADLSRLGGCSLRSGDRGEVGPGPRKYA